jgi:hypothetical protein
LQKRKPGQALDSERAGDSDPLVFLVGLVVQHFRVGAAGDRGVDFPLPLLASVPPCLMDLSHG